MQEDLHLPYILGFRAAHYFVVWCNPPLLRTAFFAAAWMFMLRIAYLTIQASTLPRAPGRRPVPPLACIDVSSALPCRSA